MKTWLQGKKFKRNLVSILSMLTMSKVRELFSNINVEIQYELLIFLKPLTP